MLTNSEQIILMVIPLLLSGLTFIAILKLNYLNLFKIPLDMGKNFNNKRIFGDNKTFHGPVVMSLSTALYGGLIYKLISSVQVDVHSLATVYFYYFVVGLFFSLGELPNSFIKRRLNIKPGQKAKGGIQKLIFTLTDSFDSLVFCAIAYYFLFGFTLINVITAIIIGGGLHFATDKLMVSIKLKRET